MLWSQQFSLWPCHSPPGARTRRGGDPLARTALLDLALRLIFLADKRGESYLVAQKRGGDCRVTFEEAEQAFAQGMEWGRVVVAAAPAGAPVRMRFAECAKGRALLTNQRIKQLTEPGSVTIQMILEIQRQLEEAKGVIAEAMRVCPEDTILGPNFLTPIKEQLEDARRALAQRGQFGGVL